MRIRHFVTLFFFTLSISVAGESCFDFFPGSFKVVQGHPAYAVEKNRFVSLACPIGKKIVAYDRLKGLCLFEDHASRPFYLTKSRPPLYFCPADKKEDVKILSYPVAIYPGKLSKRYGIEGALFGSCCKLAGIVGREGEWYDTKAIRQLMRGDIRHGDIGVRFSLHGANIIIESVDPYANVSLLPGDRVESLNGKKSPDFRSVLQMVDRCKNEETLLLGISRQGRSLTAHLNCFERLGGGKVSDTFLERFGIHFDNALRIIEIDPDKKAYERGLRKGDRLLMIDGKMVGSEHEIRDLLSGYAMKKRLPGTMLWDRAGFQFFLPLGSI